MFSGLKFVIGSIFRVLGIPNPSYNVDSVLVVVLLVCLGAIPAMWLWSDASFFDMMMAVAIMTIVLVICKLSRRSRHRVKKDD
ncbi:MAG: hypothetical protein GY778_31560 [bacterium]|nr:hypothetical protein [bacterium]